MGSARSHNRGLPSLFERLANQNGESLKKIRKREKGDLFLFNLASVVPPYKFSSYTIIHIHRLTWLIVLACVTRNWKFIKNGGNWNFQSKNVDYMTKDYAALCQHVVFFTDGRKKEYQRADMAVFPWSFWSES